VLNPDIIKDLSRLRSKSGKAFPIIVGFALETDHLLDNARHKLREKQLDLIVGNTPEAIDADKTKAFVLESNGRLTRWPPLKKADLAKKILGVLARYLRLEPAS